MFLCVLFSGPDLDEDEDEDDSDSPKPGTSNGTGGRKEKTAQQKAGEAVCRDIIDKVDGASYSFRYVTKPIKRK